MPGQKFLGQKRSHIQGRKDIWCSSMLFPSSAIQDA